MQTTTPTSMPTMPKPMIRTAAPKPRPRQRTMFTDKEMDRYRRPGTVQHRLFDQAYPFETIQKVIFTKLLV
jgi:hypothetical protein